MNHNISKDSKERTNFAEDVRCFPIGCKLAEVSLAFNTHNSHNIYTYTFLGHLKYLLGHTAESNKMLPWQPWRLFLSQK